MQLVWTVEPTLRQLEFAVDVKPTMADGTDKLRYQSYNAVVVDCSSGDLQQVAETRSTWLNRDPVLIAVTPGTTARNSDRLDEADAVWTLPLLAREMYQTLLHVRARALGDRRLRRRQPLERAAFARYTYDGRLFYEALIMDINEAGIAIAGLENLVAGSAVHVQFTLPAMLSPIQALADVVWRTDDGRAGLRFLQMPEQQHRQLERWLDQSRKGMNSGLPYAAG
jgi:hypothetical protein